MLNSIKKILAPPIYEDEEKTRTAQYLNTVLYTAIFFVGLLILVEDKPISRNILFFVFLTAVAMQVLMRRGRVQLAAIFLISLAWLAMTYMAWQGDGIRNASLIVYIILIFLASLLSNPRIFIFFTISSILMLWGLVYAEANSVITPSLDTIGNLARDLSVIFILISIVIYLTTKNTTKALSLTKKSEKEALLRNEELLKLQNELEERVNVRTAELNTQSFQLLAIAETSEAIALVQNMETLLPKITSLISEYFYFYHVGIFLLSEDTKFAQLKAANSEGGKRMLARQHQLEVGHSGIVGRVAHDGTARIALDVGQDAAYFNNPDLPNTRSEMALPLQIGPKIIGVLDVQSEEEGAFSDNDLEIFRALGNQVSIAIENARQAEITQAALKEARAISKQYTQQAWNELASTQSQHGYSYYNEHVHPIRQANVVSDEEENTISIPVNVHGAEIGFLKIQQGEVALSAENKALIESVTNRAALALENARLLNDSQRRATKEQLIGEVTNKIGTSMRMETIIQTTLKELANILDSPEIAFRLNESKNTEVLAEEK